MGLFGRKKVVPVNVHGSESVMTGMDGRYSKQARKNRKLEKQKEKAIVLEPHTIAELRGYIEEKYGVRELEKDDERYQKAYMGVKAHLIFTHAPDILVTQPIPKPNHPPVSESDPDYVSYRENEEKRWKEAVMIGADLFPMHLHVYNISVFQGETPVSWIEGYVETDHEYLAFRTIDLEYENHYRTSRIIADIVKFFGASEKDRKARNERYLQLLSVQ